MKKIIALSVLAAAPVFATAELSANLGWASEYFFRGSNLSDSSVVQGGLDFEHGGFYAGTWASQNNLVDLGDITITNDEGESADISATKGEESFEIDFYLGYGFTVGELDLGIGATTYQYENYEGSETELNLSAAYGPFALSVNPGEIDSGEDGAEKEDYVYTELSYATSVQGVDLGLALGNFTPDSDSDEDDTQHIQLDMGTTFEGLDLGVSLIEGLNADSDSGAVLFIGKSFSL